MFTQSKCNRSLLITLPALLVAACSDGNRAYEPSIDGEAVEAHVAYLADDLFEGREAGKRGYELARRYVATQFRTMGLAPGNGDSYYQEIPFKVAQVVSGSRSMQVDAPQAEFNLAEYEEFTTGATLAGEEVSITAPLVFVGYGVNIPSIERNDYEDVDLEGKIAVVVEGAPEALGSEVRAFYRSSRYHKAIELEKHGAVGVISLQHRLIASEANRIRSSKAEKYWSTDEHDDAKYAFDGIKVSANLLDAGARRLFAASPISYDDVVASIDNETYTPMELGIEATISNRIVRRKTESHNVIGILEGSDPALKNEYVVITAHLDGVGMGDEVDDNIYNGYYDNASGIGTLLEVARALSTSPERPRRSILFIATTGEEKGLLGADHFAENPTVPIESIVANINMDMVMFLWPARDVVGFGASHSTLRDALREAAEAAGLEMSPDPFPERGYFTRSDQFPFVQQGIPAVFLATGFKTTEDGTDPEALYNDFMKNHDHNATDDRRLRFDTASAGRVALVNYLMAMRVANADERPKWVKDDFFGELYGNALTRPD
jgi:Zn-dependent M28 family amino/carboxypeptidase